jgi:hypothetical protein
MCNDIFLQTKLTNNEGYESLEQIVKRFEHF